MGLLILSLILKLPTAFATEYSVARIVNVDCPSIIGPSQSFQIFVTAEYQEPLYVDVGIRDVDKDDIVQALTLISNFHGPGKESFTFNLTSPPQEGIWHLEAMTRAWWLNTWFADPLQGSMKFDIQVKELMEEENTLYTNLTIQISENIRFAFKGWSDGIESNPRKISSRLKIMPYPIYKKQFFLNVSSPINFAKGEGWYDKGDVARLEAPSKAVIEGKVYLFRGWQGDIVSNEILTEIQIDGDRKVETIWSEEIPHQDQLAKVAFLISSALIIGSLFIATAFITRKIRIKIVFLFLITLIALSSVLPATKASTDEGAKVTRAKIGDTIWRYWHNPGSDTCLIWLGGGLQSQSLFINPYWLESFNTMRYVQDLARFYSVLAIEEGSRKRYQAVLERNIYGEIYEGSNFIDKARNWLLEDGYSHIYMVGYSVGGIAAAREGIREHAGLWRSPSGIILITIPEDKSVWFKADRLRGNLLLLYGERMTESFIEAGEEFLSETPDEGRQDWGWLHKEINILPEVAHEVWTIAESGMYNPEAAWITVRFIEKAKMLSYGTKYRVESVDMLSRPEGVMIETLVEPRLALEEALRMKLKVSGLTLGNCTFVAEPLIEGIEPSIVHMNGLEKENEFLLVIPQAPNSQFKFRLFAFSKEVKYLGTYECVWRSPVIIRIMASFEGIPILIDGVEYITGKGGSLSIKTSTGKHIIEVPPDIELGFGSRLHFKGWGDWLNSTRIARARAIDVIGNIELFALYSRQFFVEGCSSIGTLSGSGWYDENSTTVLKIEDKIIEEGKEIFIFEGLNVSEQLIDGQIYVTGPIKVDAVWLRVEIPVSTPISKSNHWISIAILSLSMTIFLSTLVFAKRGLDKK